MKYDLKSKIYWTSLPAGLLLLLVIFTYLHKKRFDYSDGEYSTRSPSFVIFNLRSLNNSYSGNLFICKELNWTELDCDSFLRKLTTTYFWHNPRQLLRLPPRRRAEENWAKSVQFISSSEEEQYNSPFKIHVFAALPFSLSAVAHNSEIPLD